MNIRYLEIIEAIKETGSFTGAAKQLFITQSAVSHAVAELEKQTGTILFERLPKGIAITACGNALIEESRNILIACRNLERRMPHLEENIPLHIVSSITIAVSLLPPILKKFHESYPKFNVFVKVASADTVIDILRHGDADLAFWEGPKPEDNFEVIPLGAYNLKAACAPDFLTSKEAFSLKKTVQFPTSFERKRKCSPGYI